MNLKIKFLLILSLVLLPFFAAQADEIVKTSLEIKPTHIDSLCAARPWEDLPVYWEGVQDRRVSSTIIEFEILKRGKIAIISNPPLETAFDNALRVLLPRCGMKFVSSPEQAVYRLSASIEEFHLDLNQKAFSNTWNATSRLSFMALKPDQKTRVDVGYQFEIKKVRTNDPKKVEEKIRELFSSTLDQIPQSQTLRTLK